MYNGVKDYVGLKISLVIQYISRVGFLGFKVNVIFDSMQLYKRKTVKYKAKAMQERNR